MKKYILLSALALTMLAGCYYDKEEYLYPQTNNDPCDTTNVGYVAKVKPILDTYCNKSGCHGNGSSAAGVVLDNYASAKTATQNGNVICTITWGSGCSPMPKGSGAQLSACNIDKIKAWAHQGFKP